MRRIWLVAALVPALAHAEAGYVTDVLRLNVYATPDFSGSPVRTLISGDGFEVLVRDRLATQIQLDDGSQGYVRSAYIVAEKPARLVVAETQAEVDRLTSELAELRAAFEDPAAEISALNQRILSLSAEIETRSERIDELESEVETLRRASERYANSVPLSWSLGALLAAIVAGFLGGMRYVDRQIRKRHGGIRVL